MKQKGFATISLHNRGFTPIIILVIAILGIAGYFGFKYLPTPSPSPTATIDPIVGQFCGGIAGTACPDGYKCKLQESYPDASGVCTKLIDEISPISASELSTGWYWGSKDQKKPNTPAAWTYKEAGRSSCWHAPNVSCIDSSMKCVDKKSLNCTNEPELSFECTTEYQNWARANCPGWEEKVDCTNPRPEVCTMECAVPPPYICGSDGKSYCSSCQACSNKNIDWYVIRSTSCDEGFPL